MKHNIITFVCALFVATTFASAQITVQKSQLAPIFVVGDSINMLISNDTSANVGKTGGQNVYDFSSLNYTAIKGGVVLGSSLPITARDFAGDTILTTPGGYQAEFFSSNQMISPGKINVTSDTSYKLNVKVPGEAIFSFPLKYDESWSYSFTSYDTTFINGVAQQSSSSTDTRITTVDGYGTLKLPGGVSLPCLRLRQQSNSSPNATDLTFFYVTSTGTFIAINSFFGQPDTGTISISDIRVIEGTLPTAVRSEPQAPASFALGQNYPNPFNPTTAISYKLSALSRVSLKVYDVLGREVATLVNNEVQRIGSYEVRFDGSRLASGVYFYRLVAEGNNGTRFVSTKKLMLMK